MKCVFVQHSAKRQRIQKSPEQLTFFFSFSCEVINITGAGRRLYLKRWPMPSWMPYGAQPAFLLTGKSTVGARTLMHGLLKLLGA